MWSETIGTTCFLRAIHFSLYDRDVDLSSPHLGLNFLRFHHMDIVDSALPDGPPAAAPGGGTTKLSRTQR